MSGRKPPGAPVCGGNEAAAVPVPLLLLVAFPAAPACACEPGATAASASSAAPAARMARRTRAKCNAAHTAAQPGAAGSWPQRRCVRRATGAALDSTLLGAGAPGEWRPSEQRRKLCRYVSGTKAAPLTPLVPAPWTTICTTGCVRAARTPPAPHAGSPKAQKRTDTRRAPPRRWAPLRRARASPAQARVAQGARRADALQPRVCAAHAAAQLTHRHRACVAGPRATWRRCRRAPPALHAASPPLPPRSARRGPRLARFVALRR